MISQAMDCGRDSRDHPRFEHGPTFGVLCEIFRTRIRNQLKKSSDSGARKVFQSSVIIVYLINSPEAFMGGIALKNPEIEERCGRQFLIGEVPFNPNDWTSGLKVGISFDQVAHYLEFPSEDEYFKRFSAQPEGEDFRSLH